MGTIIGKATSLQVNQLLSAARTKSSTQFSFGNRLVEVFYFRGRKGNIFSVCSTETIQDGINKKIPVCSKWIWTLQMTFNCLLFLAGCPSICADPCDLPPETGKCRAYLPRYHHNATSGQCEQFIYGGCGGNQNRFNTQHECETACKGKWLWILLCVTKKNKSFQVELSHFGKIICAGLPRPFSWLNCSRSLKLTTVSLSSPCYKHTNIPSLFLIFIL